MDRQAIYLTGATLATFLDDVQYALEHDQPIHTLRISQEDGMAKWKVNEGIWTPGFAQDDDPSRTH